MSQTLLELLVQSLVYAVNMMVEFIQIFIVSHGVGGIHMAKSLVDVTCNHLHIVRRSPDVGVSSVGCVAAITVGHQPDIF